MLIDNWKRAGRFFSVQVALLAMTLGSLPHEWLGAMLGALGLGAERLPLVLGTAFLVARMLKQPDAPEPAADVVKPGGTD